MKEHIQARDPRDILIHARMMLNYLRSDEPYKVALYPASMKKAKALILPQAVTGENRRTAWEEHKSLKRRLDLAGLDGDLRVVDKGRWALAAKQLEDTMPNPKFDTVKQQRDIALGVSATEPEPVYRVMSARRRPEIQAQQVQPTATFDLKRGLRDQKTRG